MLVAALGPGALPPAMVLIVPGVELADAGWAPTTASATSEPAPIVSAEISAIARRRTGTQAS